MKLVYAIVLVFLLSSCKKEDTTTQPTSKKVFMRVESVSPDGISTYSPIIVTNVK